MDRTAARLPARLVTRPLPGPVVRESMTVSARAERAQLARAFVGGLLEPGRPGTDEAVLLVSELFSNSVRHSRSGFPGRTVKVSVTIQPGVIRVEIADRSGRGKPQLRPPGREAENGRGLALVAALSARWGWRRRGRRTVTWFELRR